MIGVSVGQYECQRLLGEGGTGMIYLAVHRVLHTPRAVKVLRAEWTGYPELVERFVNEARAAAAIRHRNIIGVHDCDQLESGEWYILLDFLEGGTLTRFMESHGGPLAMHDAMHVLAEVANGLQAAHDHGIVHRDLKPDNIFLSNRDGDPRAATILDFGVAKLSERAGGARSVTGVLLGTPVYMAPEQLRGEAVGPAADVFALGVIAYQMMSGGALPYQLDEERDDYLRLSTVELYQRITVTGPVDLRHHNPQVAPEWCAAIGAALHPEPGRRLQTPRELALRLAEATPGDGFSPSGVSLLQTYARELLEVGTSAATVRAPRPISGGGAFAGGEEWGRPGEGGEGGAQGARPERGGPRGAVKYQMLRKIGAGGLGAVYEGTLLGAEGFARQIAIKRIHAEKSVQPHVAAMFSDEARLAAQLIHPNLVEVLDFDRDPQGRPFLVMEYVDGQDLAALLRRGALPPPVAIFIASEMLYGLGYAHELTQRDGKRGLVHRDLSPHNVLLSRQGAVKVSDFGIAKALEGRGAVQLHELSGTPSYMSPEQVHAQPLDARSDLFAVGVILWEMLVGRRLFVGSTGTEVMASVQFKPVPPPSSLCPAVPRELDAVVMRLLERDLTRRYASAQEANAELLACPQAPRDGRSALQQLVAERTTGPVAVVSGSRTVTAEDAERRGAEVAAAGAVAAVGTAAAAAEGGADEEDEGAGREGARRAARGEASAGDGDRDEDPDGDPDGDLDEGPDGDPDGHRGGDGEVLPRARREATGRLRPAVRRLGQEERASRWPWRWSALLGPTAVAGALAVTLTTSALDGEGRALSPTAPRQTSAATAERATEAAAVAVAAAAQQTQAASPTESGGVTAGGEAATASPPARLAAPTPATAALAPAPGGEPQARGAQRAEGRRTGPPANLAPPATGSDEGATVQAARGTLIVSVRPWAAVSVDGRRYGETPLHIRLPAGQHRVQLVNQRGRRTVTVSITAARSTLLEQEL